MFTPGSHNKNRAVFTGGGRGKKHAGSVLFGSLSVFRSCAANVNFVFSREGAGLPTCPRVFSFPRPLSTGIIPSAVSPCPKSHTFRSFSVGQLSSLSLPGSTSSTDHSLSVPVPEKISSSSGWPRPTLPPLSLSQVGRSLSSSR